MLSLVRLVKNVWMMASDWDGKLQLSRPSQVRMPWLRQQLIMSCVRISATSWAVSGTPSCMVQRKSVTVRALPVGSVGHTDSQSGTEWIPQESIESLVTEWVTESIAVNRTFAEGSISARASRFGEESTQERKQSTKTSSGTQYNLYRKERDESTQQITFYSF